MMIVIFFDGSLSSLSFIVMVIMRIVTMRIMRSGFHSYCVIDDEDDVEDDDDEEEDDDDDEDDDVGFP